MASDDLQTGVTDETNTSAPLLTATANPEMNAAVAQAFQNFFAQFMTPPTSGEAPPEPRAMSLDKGSLFDKFLKGNPLELSDPNDSTKAELWLNKIEKIFALLECTSEQKVKFAEYKLQGAAENWWRMIKRQYEGRENELTWEKFLEVFNDKYYPATVRRKKQMEFHSLEQGNMSVVDYETKFVELSRFAPNQVAREEDRIFMFQKGLRPDILSKVEMTEPKTYGECIKKATIAEQGMENEKVRQQGIKRDRDQPFRGNLSGGNSNKKMVVTNQYQGEVGQSYNKPCPKCGRVHSFGTHCDGRQRTCFNCGRAGHVQHQCKLPAKLGSQSQQSSWSNKQPSNGGKFGQKSQFNNGAQNQRFDARGGSQNQNQGQKSGNQGKVFALTKEQAAASPSVVQDCKRRSYDHTN